MKRTLLFALLLILAISFCSNVFAQITVTIGDGTTTNAVDGPPAPYGTWYKAFRQQMLYRADDLYAAGGAPGQISALYFNVLDVDTCSPMRNFTIRLKATSQEALSSTFELGEYTTVWSSPQFMPTNGWNLHNIVTPFAWDGVSNLLVDIYTTVLPSTWTHNALVYCSSTSYNSSLRFQADDTNGNEGLVGNSAMVRSNIRFTMTPDIVGSLSGVVTAAGTPLAGAEIQVLDTAFSTTTATDGSYSLPYLPLGTQSVSATKHGYDLVTHSVTITEGQNTTQNFALTALPVVSVSGRIVGSDQPAVGLAGASISLSGYEPYTATTNANGQFTIAGVYPNQTYTYLAHFPDYQDATGQLVVAAANVDMGDIMVNETAFPAHQVVATQSLDYSNVGIAWQEPNPNEVGEWIHYDSGENFDSIGTGFVVDFDAAIRYPASALTDYAGMSLYAVKVWPASAGNFSLRVWTGGTAAAPGTMIIDQPFTPTLLGAYNTVMLDTPVFITGNEELWFGYRCDVEQGHPAGCDAGPALNGFSNMMYFEGAWGTLLDQSATLNVNWNIQGYVGYWAPDRANELTPLVMKGEKGGNERALTGYQVYRTLSENQANEALWSLLNPTIISTTSYTDSTWPSQPDGIYKYAVKAVYSSNVISAAAFSNNVHKGMMGTLSGIVTESGTNAPLAGATITAGEYSGTSNAQGQYSFGVYAGSCTVSCVLADYQSVSIAGVNIIALQTTTQNFVLSEVVLPPGAVLAVETSPNQVNISWTEPGVGAALTEGFETAVFPPTDWTQVITNTYPAQAGVTPTWCQVGTIISLDPEVPAHSGEYQAAIWWDFNHQDEWLITPEFTCPSEAQLSFWSYVFLGSSNGDHYYVKASTDGGNTWTNLWDASALTGGYNYYESPIVIDLNIFSGQDIKLAWHAVDSPGNPGLWYVWFVDDVIIGSADQTLRFPISTMARTSPEDSVRPLPEIVTQNLPISRELMYPSSFSSAARAANENVVERDRPLTGYKVWRLLQGQETTESAWTALTPATITANALQNLAWGDVPDGTYRWAVKSAFTGNVWSNPAFSNPVTKFVNSGTLTGFVRNPQNQGIANATVFCGIYTTTTNANGAYELTVGAGANSVTAYAAGYSAVVQHNVEVETGEITTLNFTLPVSQIILQDGFETYQNFAIDFPPWTLVDVDQSVTYGWQQTNWPNYGLPQAYIIFNQYETTPPLVTAAAHGGAKFAACFAAMSPPNNDWLISPPVPGGANLSFWAKSLTNLYGLERFNVAVSTRSIDPDDFTIISGSTYIEAPAIWTPYEYSLTAYAGQEIRIGFQCVSHDAFMFEIDDLEIMGAVDVADPSAPALATKLNANYPNPFNPETTISYSVKNAGPVSIEIYNVKGQVVKTLVSESKASGNYSVVWNGHDNNNQAVSSGVYFYKMNAGQYSSSKKMILMK